MTGRLGHKQTAAMFTLMVLGREVSNAEVKALVGFAIDGEVRRQLNDLQFVDSRLVKRSYLHELTESGWAWCASELTTETPPPPAARSTLVPALYLLAGGFGRYMRRENIRLADVFGIEVDLTEDEVEMRIRAAYRKLAEAPGDWVALADVRPLLGDAPVKFVDTVFKQLSRTRQVVLAPDSDRKGLTAADHEAAIKIGGQANHLLMIEAS